MKIKTISLALLFACLLYGDAYSQTQQITPVSPEASALAKMVNYPVNLNTGIPSISIPLYQIESGGMVLPITLNYHAGGFRINERATSVGLGWSLSSDIQITRTINGLDDFTPGNGYIANAKMKAHVFGDNYCANCDYPLWDLDYFIGRHAYDIAAGNVDGMPDKFNYSLLGKSGSFYFQKNSAGTGYTIVPVPYDNIKIAYNNGQFTIVDTDGTTYVYGSPGAGDLSTIASRAVELSGGVSTLMGTCISCKTSAWKVKKIVNATQTDSIRFTYQAKSDQVFKSGAESIEYYTNENPCGMSRYFHSNQISITNPTITTYDHLLELYPFYTLSSPKYIENFSDKPSLFHLPYLNAANEVVDKTYATNQNLNLSSSAVASLAVSRIDFSGGAVVFSGTDKLNSITVRDANNNEIRSFNFFQSYKNAAFINEAKQANGPNFNGTAYLDSIQIRNNSTVYESYRLVYKDKYCFGDHLKGQDAWGYPNASTAERALMQSEIAVPHQQLWQRFYKETAGGACTYVDDVEFNIGNVNNTESPEREPAQRGILKSIIYPTGGYVDFDFESNKYSSPTNDENLIVVRMGGGLRIKTISYFDGKLPQPATQKYYRYGEMEDGIGLLINSPTRDVDGLYYKYNAFSYAQTTAYLTGPPSSNLGSNFEPIPTNCFNRGCLNLRFKEKKTTYLPASSINYNYSNGSPIYYTKVTEYNQDMGMFSGKKVYSFYSPEEFDVSHASYNGSKIDGTNIDFLKTDGLMGAQKMLEEFKFEKDKYVLEHRKEFVYTKYSRPQMIKVVYSFFNTIYSVIGGSFDANAIELYNSNYSFASGESYGDFSAGQYGIEVGKLLLSSEIETWMRDSVFSYQETAYNYNNSEYLQPSSIITTNTKGEQITKSLKYSYDFSGQSVYDQMVAKNRISQPIEETVYNNSLSKEISKTRTNFGLVNAGFGFIAPTSVVKSNGGNALDTLITYDLYDQHANILQITEKNALVKSYIWGYDYKYPVAEITGLNYAQATSGINVFSLQSIDNEIQLRTILDNLRNALPEALVKTFTFKPLRGVSSQTNTAGLNNFYEYDPFGRLSIIRDHNNHILKKYDYKTIGTASSYGNNGYYVNSPLMGTFFKVCDNLSIRSFNYVMPGGALSTPSSSTANYAAYNGLEQGGTYNDDDNGCSIPNNIEYVKINLYSHNMPYMPGPNDVNIDFIKDGAIVASRRFPENNVSGITLYIPKGEYTISLRQDENFNGSVISYYVTPTEAAGYYIKTGQLLNFVSGVVYDMSASNIY